MSTLSARLVGGPTAIVEYAGMRWLTDPAFSPPGQYGALVKTTGPAISSAPRFIATAWPTGCASPGAAKPSRPDRGRRARSR